MIVQENTVIDERAALIDRIEKRDFHLSYSSLKQFAKSPAHFIDYKLKKFEPTDAMNEGTLVDMLLTEPENVEKAFLVLPEGASFATKAGTVLVGAAYGLDVPDDKHDNQKSMVRDAMACDERIAVTQAVMDKCEYLANRVRSNRASSWIFKHAEAYQHPVEFERYGWKWRGRMDIYAEQFYKADLKKTKDADPRKFRWQAKDLKYAWQGAIYSHDEPDTPFFNVAFDNDGHVSVHEHTPAALELAWDEIARVVDRFDECVALNEWHRSYDFWPENWNGIHSI